MNLSNSYQFKTPSKTSTVKVESFRRIDDYLSGIYVFRGNYGECLYVGQTKNFRKRFASHLTTSSFSRLIHSADIYQVDNPFLREIFETIFIDEMRPQFNRAKAYSKQRGKQDAILFEIELLEGERSALEEEKAEILDAVNQVDDDDYYDPYEHFTDFDEGLITALGESLRFVERLPEVETEIKELTRKINRLHRKIA